MRLRISKRGLDTGIHAAQKVLTKADTLALIPGVGLVEILLSFRSKDHFSGHAGLSIFA